MLQDHPELYDALADRHPGAVLELVCGSGQLTVPLARPGRPVAGLDSGIYNVHVMFEGAGGSKRVVRNVDFVCMKCKTPHFKDMYGHGTHVAGLLASNDRILSGAHAGIAPGATLFNLRVLDGNGAGTVSGVLHALNWVTDEAGVRHYDHLFKTELVTPGNKIVSSARTSYTPFQTPPTRASTALGSSTATV